MLDWHSCQICYPLEIKLLLLLILHLLEMLNNLNFLFHICRQKKEERMKKLTEKLSADAKDSVARMIEKHSQEMLLMIAKRLAESEAQVNISV